VHKPFQRIFDQVTRYNIGWSKGVEWWSTSRPRNGHAVELEDKLSPKWVGPFRVKEVLLGGPYKSKILDRTTIPRKWNAANLWFYFS